jgi:hypothetical protein
VNEFKIPPENIVAAVTDCAPVMKAGMREAGIPAVSCCAHVVVKALEYAMKSTEVSDIRKLAGKADALHHNHRFAEVLQTFYSELGIKNMKTFSPTRWDDVTLVTEMFVKLQPAIEGFQNMRGVDGKPLYGPNYDPITEEDFALATIASGPFMKVQSKIEELETAFNPDGSRSDVIFRALPIMIEIAEDVSQDFIAAGLVTTGKELRAQIHKRLLKYPESLKMLFKATLLNANMDVDALLMGLPSRFVEIKTEVETELIRIGQMTQGGANGQSPSQLRGQKQGGGTENEYRRFRAAAQTAEVIPDVANHWKQPTQFFPRLQRQARMVAAIPPSSAPVERVFAEGRAVFDYYQGGCADQTISRRLFCKVNRKLLERVATLPPVVGE